MAYDRVALPLDQWPIADREAWRRARLATDIFDESGRAAQWTAKTVRPVVTSYGLWLACLAAAGRLAPKAPPAARASQETLAMFLEMLKARGIASITLETHVRNLREALRVMDPGGSLAVLSHVLARLSATAAPRRVKSARIVSPQDLCGAGLAIMKAAAGQPPTRNHASRYRDGLMIAFLALRPLRLANLTAIEVGRHLVATGDGFECRFDCREMKEGVPIAFPFPDRLVPDLQRYVETYRPLLLRGRDLPQLWISLRSTAMEENSIYYRIVEVTRQALGRPVNPHLFRDCAATFIAEQAPEEVGIVSRLLAHNELRTAEQFYNHADALSAQRRHAAAVARLRAALIEESMSCAR